MTFRRFHGPAARVIRTAYGIRHGVLAEKVGISRPHLTNIERGIKQPSPAVMVKIANELGVNLEDVTYVVATEEAS